jgi:hypothetical protein
MILIFVGIWTSSSKPPNVSIVSGARGMVEARQGLWRAGSQRAERDRFVRLLWRLFDFWDWVQELGSELRAEAWCIRIEGIEGGRTRKRVAGYALGGKRCDEPEPAFAAFGTKLEGVDTHRTKVALVCLPVSECDRGSG